MSNSKKPLAAALGAAFLASSVVPLASAEVNPFSAEPLSSGYNLANYDKDADRDCGDRGCGDKGDGQEHSCGGAHAGGDEQAGDTAGDIGAEGGDEADSDAN